MKRNLLRAILFVTLAFLAGEIRAATFNVDVAPGGAMSYSPSQLSIEVGDTVVWTWRQSNHTVTALNGAFNSNVKNSGATFSHTFSSAGSFPYFCTIHGAIMSGNVDVTNAPASPTPTSTPTATATPTAAPTPTATPTPTPLLPRIGGGPVRIELQAVASGLTAPIDFVSANDGTGRMFIVNQTGQIQVLKNGQVLATPFLDVSSRLVPLMAGYDERGLLGLVFHPGYSDSNSPGFRKLYTYTSEPVNGAADFTVPMPAGTAFNHQSVIAEWQVSAANPDVVDPATRREVMRIDEPQFNHNAGQLVFRPSDHYLYISLGDGGNANDVGAGHNAAAGNGQDNTTVLGKILRIDPLTPALTPSSSDLISGNGKYRIPASNPFVANAAIPQNVREIFAWGFRNPFRFSFDAVTDKLIVADVGQDHIEEIDLVEPGKNYGWNKKEGTFLFDPATGNVTLDSSPNPAFTNPVAQYSHDDGIAVLGGYLYRGATVSALTNKYVFGDFSTTFTAPKGRLFYMDDLNSGVIRELRIGNVERPFGLFLKAFGRDANGEIYALGSANLGPSGNTGQVLKIVPAPASPAFVNLATRMRVQTGDNVLIGGFILIGSTPKKVIVRAIGPSLTVNGQPLPGRLSDPTLTLFDGAGNPIFTNDDWTKSSQIQAIMDSTIPPSDPKESAIVSTLQPGNYTAIMSGSGTATGIGVLELYDLETSAPANPANIATRGFVESGDNVMIGGFIVGGSQNRTVFIRAIGPSLTAVGVPNALPDPVLELRDAAGTLLGLNDSWRSDQQNQIIATGIPPNDDREAAMISAPLSPGNYTAVVRGKGTDSGVALVEIYQLQ